MTRTCLACAEQFSGVLAVTGSVRCMDCRNSPLASDDAPLNFADVLAAEAQTYLAFFAIAAEVVA